MQCLECPHYKECKTPFMPWSEYVKNAGLNQVVLHPQYMWEGVTYFVTWSINCKIR